MLRAGLIGVASSGKTTLFHLLTRPRDEGPRQGARQDASVGLALVPDPRLDRLAGLYAPRKRTPATVTFVDMAARAAAGAALVDVAPYRTANALLHVVRAFRDDTVPHPAESVDPGRDVRAMEDELILADLAVAERRMERIEKDRRKGAAGDQDGEFDILRRCAEALEAGVPLRSLDFDRAADMLFRGFQFLSAKPLLLVMNVDEADAAAPAEEVARSAGLDDFVQGPGIRALAVCAKIELEIAELDPADAGAFLADLGLRGTGLDRVIRATYDLLGYVSFFTVGEDECRAWSIAAGTRAQDAAGEIHTDMARGFIRAEVVACEPLLARGTLAECRRHAEVRLEGRDYVVRDGDVINVRFAT